MKIKAYGFNLHENEYELIRNMVKVVSDEPPDIYDIRSYDIHIDPNDTVFLFGQRTVAACASIVCNKLEFPDISRLDGAYGDPEERIIAFQLLSNFKTAYKTQVNNPVAITNVQKLTEETLPADLTADKIQALEIALRSKGRSEWVGKTKDGKTVRLTIDPETSSADINLTFAELLAVRTAMEIFKIKELEIVYSTSNKSTC